jgi:hypothetical protein
MDACDNERLGARPERGYGAILIIEMVLAELRLVPRRQYYRPIAKSLRSF